MSTIFWIIGLIMDRASAFFSGKEAGRAERDAEIAADNKSAKEKARLAALDVYECEARGGTWNQRTGRCE